MRWSGAPCREDHERPKINIGGQEKPVVRGTPVYLTVKNQSYVI